VTTGFSFGTAVYPRGGIYGPLRHEYAMFLVLYKGSAKVEFDDTSCEIQNGCCTLIRCQESLLISYHTDRLSEVGWCEASITNLYGATDLTSDQAPLSIPLSDRIRQLQRLGVELGDESYSDLNELRNSLGRALFRAYLYEINLSGRSRNIPNSLLIAKRFLEENYLSEEFLLKRLALRAAVSPQYLNYMFRKFLGTTPAKYYWRLKAERGYQMLMQTSLSVSEIAYHCGYKTPYHFSRQIKDFFFHSPTMLRENRGYRDPSDVVENITDVVF
jgi:AraC family L-rhamnose operon regulatory protein RhaS